MPITPLHIGIPGLIGFAFRKKVEISGLILGSILIDIDFFLYLFFKSPIHGNLHTFLGAILLSLLLISSIYLLKGPIDRIKEMLKWRIKIKIAPLSTGVFIGTFSHVLLDSFIYNDIHPFYPVMENFLYYESSGYTFILIYVLTIITTIAFLFIFILIAIDKK